MHDVVASHSATSIIHLLNQTPGAWTRTHQHQVETTTYGSEFMVARQAIDQTVDICYTLCMFRVLLDAYSWVLGDNHAIINSTMILHSSLSKCSDALSYHHCKAVAAGICHFEHIPSSQNPSDVLTKNLPWAKAHAFIKPFFWKGETTSGTTHQRERQADLVWVPDGPPILPYIDLLIFYF